MILKMPDNGGAASVLISAAGGKGSVRFEATEGGNDTAPRGQWPYAVAISAISESQRMTKCRRCSAGRTYPRAPVDGYDEADFVFPARQTGLTAGGLTGALLGTGGGYLIAAAGFREFFLLSSALTLLGAVVFWLALLRRGQREGEPDAARPPGG